MRSPHASLKEIITENSLFHGGWVRGVILFLAFQLVPVSLSANSVISWGRQVLPPPHELTPLLEASAGDGFNIAIKPNGEVIAWGSNNYRQAAVPPDLGSVIAVEAGASHALALRSDGTVVAWGNNRDEQANVPDNLENVVAISAGRAHSLALHSDGSVSAWGSNRYAQTTPLPGLEKVTAISAGNDHNLALLSDGTVVAWGLNTDGQASVPEGLTDVIAIAAGGAHSLALRRDGTLVAWGNNDFAQITVPDQASGIKQISAGQDHNLVLLEDGRTIVWGRNHYGQLDAPVELPPARRVAAGADHSVVLLEEGSFAAWGRNDHGQSLNLEALSSVVSFSAWDNHTIALRDDGTVFWWGTNLAAGVQPNPQELQNVVAVAAGRAHGLALRSNGTVVAWGDNLYGQASPPPNLNSVVAIAAGEFHSLALRSDGTIAAWGNNFHEQVDVPRGLDNVVDISGGQEHSLALTLEGLVYSWGDDFHGQRQIPATLENAVAVASGNLHNLALRENGTLAAWGSNLFGQCDVPNGLSDVVAIAAGRSHSVAIRENRTVIAWGGNYYNQSEVPPGLDQVIDVAAGNARTAVVVGEMEAPTFVTRFESMAVPAGEDLFIMPLISGTRPFIYQWMKDGVPIEDATGPALDLSRVGALDSGSYSLIIANRAGNSTSQSFSIEVNDPSVEIEATPQVATLGQKATFTAWARGSSPFEYQWLKDGEEIAGANNMQLVVENVQAEDTGNYAVQVSNEFGTTTSEAIRFLVAPHIASQPPADAVARIGERLTLEIEANGSQPLEIQWLREGIPLPEATGKTLVLPDVQVSDGGIYSAVVSNEAGRIQSDPVTIRIIPYIIFQPESQVFSTFGGTAVFDVRATGSPPLTYNWMKDGQFLVSLTEPRLVIEQVRAEDAGEYQVVVANEAGEVTSEPANLVVPPFISSHPQSQTVKAGENVEFTVRASGSQPFEYQWLKNGEPLRGEEGTALQLQNVNGTDSARYSVVVTNEVGSDTSQDGMLSISPNIVTAPESVVASPGSEVALLVEAEGGSPLFYQWTKDGNLLSEARSESLIFESVDADDAGFYSVIVSNAAGIAISDSVQIEVK